MSSGDENDTEIVFTNDTKLAVTSNDTAADVEDKDEVVLNSSDVAAASTASTADQRTEGIMASSGGASGADGSAPNTTLAAKQQLQISNTASAVDEEDDSSPPKLALKASADAEIKYADDSAGGTGADGPDTVGVDVVDDDDARGRNNQEMSSDLDSDLDAHDKAHPLIKPDIYNTSYNADSANLTPHGNAQSQTPHSRDSQKNGSRAASPVRAPVRPTLRPSASQQASEARDSAKNSPRVRPRLQPATTSSKKPQLDIHDIRHFARNTEVSNEFGSLAIEMEPTNQLTNENLDNNEDEPQPDASGGELVASNSGSGAAMVDVAGVGNIASIATVISVSPADGKNGGAPGQAASPASSNKAKTPNNSTFHSASGANLSEMKEQSASSLVESLRNDASVAKPTCVVGDWLYLGTGTQAAHIGHIKNLQITHVLNVTDKVPCYFLNDPDGPGDNGTGTISNNSSYSSYEGTLEKLSAEIGWHVDYARIPIPNKEYSLIYDYFKAAQQFIDLCNPDEDTTQLEKDISRNDRRDAKYNFGTDDMVVLSSGSNGGRGGTDGNNAGQAANTLQVLNEGKEMDNANQQASNLDDADQMEFAYESGEDFDTRENSKNNLTNENSLNRGAIRQSSQQSQSNPQQAMIAGSIELGQNSDQNAGHAGAGSNASDAMKGGRKGTTSATPLTLGNTSSNNNSFRKGGNDVNDYGNRFRNAHNKNKIMSRKILVHCSSNLSRSATIVIAYLVAKQLKYDDEERRIINEKRIDLFKQDAKYAARIREKKPLEKENKYVNELVNEIDKREIHLVFYYNEKAMKQLKRIMKKQEKLYQEQMKQLEENNLSQSSTAGGGLQLVSQQSQYTDNLRVKALKHQTDIYALGYVGGMSLAVAYHYVRYFASGASPNNGFLQQLSIWEKKKRHGISTYNDLPNIRDIKSAITWVKGKAAKDRHNPEEQMYGAEIDDGPIPPEPTSGCCVIL